MKKPKIGMLTYMLLLIITGEVTIGLLPVSRMLAYSVFLLGILALTPLAVARKA